MSLLSRAAPVLCPTCQHPRPGLLGRLVEPLVWTTPCCHILVHDPLAYPGDDECGCRDEAHRPMWGRDRPRVRPGGSHRAA